MPGTKFWKSLKPDQKNKVRQVLTESYFTGEEQPWQDFLVAEPIASGTWGSVFLAKDPEECKNEACLTIKIELVKDDIHKTKVQREFDVNVHLRDVVGWDAKQQRHFVTSSHSGLIPGQDLGLAHGEKLSYMVTDYVPDAINLYDAFKKAKSRRTLVSLVKKELPEALEQMRQARILHGDLHTRNILVTNKGGANAHLKIIDWGMSQIYTPESGQRVTASLPDDLEELQEQKEWNPHYDAAFLVYYLRQIALAMDIEELESDSLITAFLPKKTYCTYLNRYEAIWQTGPSNDIDDPLRCPKQKGSMQKPSAKTVNAHLALRRQVELNQARDKLLSVQVAKLQSSDPVKTKTKKGKKQPKQPTNKPKTQKKVKKQPTNKPKLNPKLKTKKKAKATNKAQKQPKNKQTNKAGKAQSGPTGVLTRAAAKRQKAKFLSLSML